MFTHDDSYSWSDGWPVLFTHWGPGEPSFQSDQGCGHSWPEAQYLCRQAGAELASVHSRAETMFLRQLNFTKHNVWIGLARDGNDLCSLRSHVTFRRSVNPSGRLPLPSPDGRTDTRTTASSSSHAPTPVIITGGGTNVDRGVEEEAQCAFRRPDGESCVCRARGTTGVYLDMGFQ
ncbi:hypothetical protein CRUP_009685 [Coryphaenoides rupestris]|nr:hypothetical protein CRUP_009685 [Coryphaenoides rupestris]